MSGISYEEAVRDHAVKLGIDPEKERQFLWLAEESMRAPHVLRVYMNKDPI